MCLNIINRISFLKPYLFYSQLAFEVVSRSIQTTDQKNKCLFILAFILRKAMYLRTPVEGFLKH